MQKGTLSGNPVAAVAGLKTLEILRRPGSYEQLRSLGETLMLAITKNLSAYGHAHKIVGEPSLFDVVFVEGVVQNYRDFLRGNLDKETAFNESLRQNGVLKSPNKMYMSLALNDDDITQTIDAVSQAAKCIVDL